jgi:3-oxoacyl-[acyl-carrier protein] reductase
MNLNLKEKVALITGGTHGIGRAIALSLADESCNIAVCSRDTKKIDETLEQLKKLSIECIGIQADVMNKVDIERVVNQVINKWGTIHILVNSVGGGGRWGSDIVEETKEEVFSEVYSKNVLSAIRFTMLVIPFMRKQKFGRVVTISSVYGKEAGARPWYAIAKTAEIAFMKSLAIKHYLAKDNITFNSIAPGAIMIPDTGWDIARKEKPQETEEFLKNEIPVERFGIPEEVGGLVAFLCSEKASFINGSSISIDGGQGRTL